MKEIRKVEPVEKIVNQKENKNKYFNEEKIENKPNNFGILLKEEQEKLSKRDKEIKRRQLEGQKEYLNILKDKFETSKKL